MSGWAMGQVRADQRRIHAAVQSYITSATPPRGFLQRTQKDLHDQETAKVQQRFQQLADANVPGHGGDVMDLFL